MDSLPRETFYETISTLPYFVIVDQFVRSATAPYPVDSDFWHWIIQRKLQKISLKEYFDYAVLAGELRVVEILVADYDIKKYVTTVLMKSLVTRCDNTKYSKTYFEVFLLLAQYCSLDGIIGNIRSNIFAGFFKYEYEAGAWNKLILRNDPEHGPLSKAEADEAVFGIARQLIAKIPNVPLRELLLSSLGDSEESVSESETTSFRRKPNLIDVISPNSLSHFHPKVACFFQQYFLVSLKGSKRDINVEKLLDFYLCCEATTFNFTFNIDGEERDEWYNWTSVYDKRFNKEVFGAALAHTDDSMLRKVFRLKSLDVDIRTNHHIRADFLEIIIENLPFKQLNVDWAYRNDPEMFAIYRQHEKTALMAEKAIAKKKAKRKYKKVPRKQARVVIDGPLYVKVRAALRRRLSYEDFQEIIRLVGGGKYLLSFQTVAGNGGSFFLNKQSLASFAKATSSVLTDDNVQIADYMRNFVADPVTSFNLRVFD